MRSHSSGTFSVISSHALPRRVDVGLPLRQGYARQPSSPPSLRCRRTWTRYGIFTSWASFIPGELGTRHRTQDAIASPEVPVIAP